MLPRFTRPLALLLLVTTPFVAVRAEEEKKPETVVTVSVGKVVRSTLRAYVTGYGTVETSPTGGARLAAAASGLVVAVPVLEGASVAAGVTLVQLDSRAADAALVRARTAVANAEKSLARQTQLQAADGTSARALQEAEDRLAAAQAELAAAQLQHSQLAIRAPLAGTIARLTVKPGEWLDAGKEVGELVNFDRLVLHAQVSAAEASAVRAGQSAALLARLGSDEKPVATGTVDLVAPRVTPGTDSVLVRVTLPPGAPLRAGQFCGVRLVTEERTDRLAVPRESVYTDGEGQSTLSVVTGDVARQITVQAGLRDGDLVEVTGTGLAEGTTVVTIGSYALPKETKIRMLASAAKEAAK